MYIKI